jgi:DNA-binding NtrC family response regulator
MSTIRILLIEDSQSDTQLMKAILTVEKMDFALTNVERLADGLAKLKEQNFDVIITDLGLPDSIGLNPVAELHHQAPHLPLIVLTRLGDEETALEAIKMGAQDYLPKDRLEGIWFARTINYAIERQRLTRQLTEALENVKTLNGLLPVCASCRKVRDDKGYWSQIETYIQKHTTASFTHGMCPECAKKWFKEAGVDYPTAGRTEA